MSVPTPTGGSASEGLPESFRSSGDGAPAASLPGQEDRVQCVRCGGLGGWRYVYCTACAQYVNGRYGTLSLAEELLGQRPPIITECGHEVFTLPGEAICPDCGGGGLHAVRAA